MTRSYEDAVRVFTRDIRVLMLLRIMRQAIDLFAGSFLIAYLLDIAQNDIKPIALYCGFFAFSAIITFFLFGSYTKSKNKIILLRWGTLFSFIHILIISYLKQEAIHYMIPLGISYGFYSGLYYTAWNNLIPEKVSINRMGKFMGYLTSIGNTSKIAASFIFGKYISLNSFEACLSIILTISIIEFIASFLIKSPKTSHERFEPLNFFNIVKTNDMLQKALFIEFIKGLTFSGCLGMLIIICTVHKYGSNADFGAFNGIFSFVTILIAYIFGRYIRRRHYPALSLINSFFIILTMMLFTLYDTKLNFILYNLCYATFIQLIQLVTDVNMFNITNSEKIKHTYKIEYIATREAYLNCGRIIGYGLMFLAGTFDGPYALKYLMIFFTLGVSYVGMLSNNLQRELEQGDDEGLRAYVAAE